METPLEVVLFSKKDGGTTQPKKKNDGIWKEDFFGSLLGLLGVHCLLEGCVIYEYIQ